MDSLFSREAEQNIIGALLVQPNAFDNIHWLQSSAFYEHTHKLIYSVIVEMMGFNKPVDIVTVAEELEKKKQLSEVGGLSYLAELVKNNTGAYNIVRYAEIVQEKNINRQMVSVIDTIKGDLLSSGDIYKKLERAQNMILSIAEKADSNEPVFVRDILPERIDRIDDAFQGNIKLLSTGLLDLDERLGGGIEGGALIVIAACASMGKTALAIQLAEALQDENNAALVFSIEMSNGLIVDRLIANKSHIAGDKIRTGKLEDTDWENLTVSIGKLQKLNMLLDDRTNKLNGMKAKARAVKRKHGLSCIVIDYIGLMLEDEDSRSNSREQQISNITRGLKALAKELNIPVIALSQLNRKVSERTNKRPLMSDLRDSGAIEQDADVIMFVYRDDYYNPDSEYKGLAEINVAKNRNGATGAVIVNFEKERTHFSNHAGGISQFVDKPTRRAQYD